MNSLHVLVIGPLDGGACSVYRFGMHAGPLAARGIELRAFTGARLAVPAEDSGTLDRAYASAGLVMDRSQLDWADVIVFRRFYTSHWTCADCAFTSDREGRARLHGTSVNHEIAEPDRLIRPLYDALEGEPALLRGRAVVYETDDDLFGIQAWNGMRFRVERERDIIERMLRRADLVTVSTPTLQARLASYNDEIRVVRNAIEPGWYQAAASAPPVAGSPRILYYGSPSRMRDYEVCRAAVDTVAATTPGARRVWLGALNARAGGAAARVLDAVDEAGPYIADTQAFAAALAAARPDIGLAPLVGDAFDASKSELHWLEYTMAGAATVASCTAAYAPIRDGIDGMLASSGDEWLAALQRLASSPALRADLVGRARERVLAEYTVDVRADEWAAAYRWAAEHPGRRVQGRVHGLGALADGPLAAEGRASLAHRMAMRDASLEAPRRLADARGPERSCAARTGQPPVVTVVVPIADEPIDAVERSVLSALTGSHRALDVVLVSDADLPLDRVIGLDALASADPCVRRVEVPVSGGLPPAAGPARRVRVGRLLAAGVASAQGDWIAPVAPGAAFTPDHVAALLGIAVEHELEFVYGQASVLLGDAAPVQLGTWPPSADGVLPIGTELFAAALATVVPFDEDAWRDGESTAWAFWRSALEAGVRMAGAEYVVTTLGPLAPHHEVDGGVPVVSRSAAPDAGVLAARTASPLGQTGAATERPNVRAVRRGRRGRGGS